MFQADQCKKGKTAMQKTLILTLTIVILSSMLCSACSQATSTEDLESLYIIRHATVLITMQLPKVNASMKKTISMGYGIGSLIEYHGEILLVTHNHWHKVLEDTSLVKFYDADNHLLKTIIGTQWRDLIVHADPGTLVLRPPQELLDPLDPVSLQAVPQVTSGEMVEIVYRENPSRETAGILEAVVEEVTIYKDQPVYKLRTLDGQAIQPGDSGGGIWYQGCLVGNNWTVTAKSTLTPEDPDGFDEDNVVYTDTSFGAILPEELP
jgi:hypothetical protein